MQTTFLSDELLDHVLRNAAYTSPTNVYAGLLESVTDLEAGTVGETAYTGYARVAITFGAPGAGLNGRQCTNSAAVTFGQKTDAGTVTIIAVGINDASTVGNWLHIIMLDGTDPFVAIADAGDVTANTLQAPAHPFANDDRFRLEAIPGTGSIPAGLSANTTYWVTGTPNVDDFQPSLTQDGAAVDITGKGAALVMPLLPKDITQNDTPEFATSALVVAYD